jgi:ParB family chromosome partitioning protein
MAERRLGKGLSALIPELDAGDLGRSQNLREINVRDIRPNPFQPREEFDPQALEELKSSIEQMGVIQPVTVRQTDFGFELIAGERRLRAVRDLGFDTIPAYILDVSSDEEMLELSLIENIQRENLNPIDEAKGYRRLIDECRLTQEEVAQKVGKDRTTIANLLRLLKLPDPVQEALRRGELTTGHARALLSLPTRGQQVTFCERVVRERLSVRQVESLVKRELSKPKKTKKVVKDEAPPFVREAEDALRRSLGTQVRVHRKGSNGGWIEVQFYSDTDLERLLELIARG